VEQADQIVPSTSDILWPNIMSIRCSQESSKQRPNGLNLNHESNLLEKDGRIWVPNEDLELQLKILVLLHCGSIGYRGMDGTSSILKENFYWESLEKDVSKFVKGCLHCLITRTGDAIPRPLAHALHGEKPNEVVHLDFLYMGAGVEGLQYILIIRDDLSSYVWLFPKQAATAEEAADALVNWIGSFGCMEWLCSDQGSRFKNELLRELSSELKVSHHFTTAYSPWANGSVERICTSRVQGIV